MRRKIPRKTVEALMETCESMSEKGGKSAVERFRRYLQLMDRYGDYFFSEPWPEKYDYDEATKFTDDDIEFLTEGEDDEFGDRFDTLLLKKNVNLELGFQGEFGMYWTQEAFRDRFVRPGYTQAKNAFRELAKEHEDPRDLLDELKKKFDVQKIHDSLVDLMKHEYPFEHETVDLVNSILELLHSKEGVPPCDQYHCQPMRNRTKNGELNTSS